MAAEDAASISSSSSNNHCSSVGFVTLRVCVPELQTAKSFSFNREAIVWDVKQTCLASLPKDLKEGFNYGLFYPPENGKAGKFLDEERPLSDYPFSQPENYLELKYKRRVYKMLKLEEKAIKALHSRANLKKFMDIVRENNTEKVTKMCGKGMDPNYHCGESGETPLSMASQLKKPSQLLLALVNGGAILDFRTRDGLTALHRAVERSNLEAVRTLLDLGASPNYKDLKGLTPLYYSILEKTEPILCETLLHDHATIGARDGQGWYEVHQACRNNLVQHLEFLVYYGADMNARNASGNTPLHVCAVNNVDGCARVLLFRGAERDALNFANQTPYQVAVIAGNIELSEMIRKHKPEDVVPFRDVPKYNPKRRISMNPGRLLLQQHTTSSLASSSSKPPSPSPSSASLPPFSSASSVSEAGSCVSSTGTAAQHRLDSPAVEGDEGVAGEGQHLAVMEEEPPASSNKMLGDNSCNDGSRLVSSNERLEGDELALPIGADGWNNCAPAENMECKPEGCSLPQLEAALPSSANDSQRSGDITPSAAGSKQGALLLSPTGSSSAGKVRTVTLIRGPRGFGFVLRGARAQSPLVGLEPTSKCPALQYLDQVEDGGVAASKGLLKGDFLLEINGEDVSKLPHEKVVERIRDAGDRVTMSVVTVPRLMAEDMGEEGRYRCSSTNTNGHRGAGKDELSPSERLCSTLPRKLGKEAPPVPKRDPRTSLSVGRARAKSFVGNLQESTGFIEGKTATIRRPSARKLSEDVFKGQRSPVKVYASVAELKRQKQQQQQQRMKAAVNGDSSSGGVAIRAEGQLHKAFHSTPDLQAKLEEHPICDAYDGDEDSVDGDGATSSTSRLLPTGKDDGKLVNAPDSCSGPAVGGNSNNEGHQEFCQRGAVLESKSDDNVGLLLRRNIRSAAAGAGGDGDHGRQQHHLPPPPCHPPPPPPSEIVRVDVGISPYETVKVIKEPEALLASAGSAAITTTVDDVRSSFRPEANAKIYASPRDISVEGGYATLRPDRARGLVDSSKNRSQSLPPGRHQQQLHQDLEEHDRAMDAIYKAKEKLQHSMHATNRDFKEALEQKMARLGEHRPPPPGGIDIFRMSQSHHQDAPVNMSPVGSFHLHGARTLPAKRTNHQHMMGGGGGKTSMQQQHLLMMMQHEQDQLGLSYDQRTERGDGATTTRHQQLLRGYQQQLQHQAATLGRSSNPHHLMGKASIRPSKSYPAEFHGVGEDVDSSSGVSSDQEQQQAPTHHQNQRQQQRFVTVIQTSPTGRAAANSNDHHHPPPQQQQQNKLLVPSAGGASKTRSSTSPSRPQHAAHQPLQQQFDYSAYPHPHHYQHHHAHSPSLVGQHHHQHPHISPEQHQQFYYQQMQQQLLHQERIKQLHMIEQQQQQHQLIRRHQHHQQMLNFVPPPPEFCDTESESEASVETVIMNNQQGKTTIRISKGNHPRITTNYCPVMQQHQPPVSQQQLQAHRQHQQHQQFAAQQLLLQHHQHQQQQRRTFKQKHLVEWTVEDTAEWLESLFMPEYKKVFVECRIDGRRLMSLNNEALLALGVKRVGHRLNIEKSLKRFMSYGGT